MSHAPQRGQIGLIVLLLALLGIASLVILNFRGKDTKGVEQLGVSAPSASNAIQHFQNETKRIEDQQRAREVLPEIPQ